MFLQRIIPATFFSTLVLSASVMANTIISGDLSIRDGGDVVFSDGSVQSKAQVQGLQGVPGPQGIQGPAGPAGGPNGATGPQGLQGLQGFVGPVGATGAVGITWKGLWDSATSYNLRDAVNYNGASYLSITSGNLGFVPTNTSFWAVLAQKGDTGSMGLQGLQGVIGVTGAQGPLGSAGLQGAVGPAGATGAPGAAAPPLTLATMCAAITAGGGSLPAFCPLTDPTTGMTLQRVTGGAFSMGDTFGDGSGDELPVHQVTVGDFYIGRYEVTQGQWQTVMGSNPSGFTACGAGCPVEQVSWDDIQTFITTLNQRSGKTYRLPTEAEWEYAARSGGKSEKYSGGSDVTAVAWYSANSGGTTHPVGQKQANGLGLYDMSGNVWEWVSDWYGRYGGTAAQVNPQGPTTGSYRVSRGGSWLNPSAHVRASRRDSYGPGARSSSLGFRLVAPVQ